MTNKKLEKFFLESGFEINMSIKEIALDMGLTKQTVRKILKVAMIKAKANIERMREENEKDPPTMS